jgi:phospholipase/carboxylesterase
MIDPTLFGGALTGRMAFRPGAAPLYEPLPPGRHDLGFDEGRDAVLVVPEGLPAHARSRGFLLLAPQSMYATWDIVVGGHGPDLERLDNALATVSRHFRLDPARLALAGFSDGGSYALSLGLTNGDVASHVIGLSAGFMNSFAQAGTPRFFLAHGRSDSQLPIETSAHPHARRLLESGHDLTLQPFDGDHVIVPWVVGRAVAFFLGDDAAKPA